MLSILLINENKIVSRLFQLSSQKHNYDLEEVSDYSSKENSYNIVFVDSKIYDEEKLNNLKATVSFDKITYLGDKGTKIPLGFDLLLEKPFLPTDFVNLMNENFKVVDSEDEFDFENEEIDELDELDLDNLDDLELDEKVVDNDTKELDEELDLDSLDDVMEESIIETVESENLPDETKEELADMVAEIDELDQNKEISNSYDDIDLLPEDAIVSEDLVKESIKEVEEESNMTTNISMTAAGIVAATTMAKDEESKNDILDDELDSLNVKEVEEVMLGDSTNESKVHAEVVEEEISQAQERVVETNDLEEMITKAVSKALSKEVILEALKDMDVIISFQPKENS